MQSAAKFGSLFATRLPRFIGIPAMFALLYSYRGFMAAKAAIGALRGGAKLLGLLTAVCLCFPKFSQLMRLYLWKLRSVSGSQKIVASVDKAGKALGAITSWLERVVAWAGVKPRRVGLQSPTETKCSSGVVPAVVLPLDKQRLSRFNRLYKQVSGPIRSQWSLLQSPTTGMMEDNCSLPFVVPAGNGSPIVSVGEPASLVLKGVHFGQRCLTAVWKRRWMCVGVGCGCYILLNTIGHCYREHSLEVRELYSKLVEYFRVSPRLHPETIRDKFSTIPTIEVKSPKNHTHAEAAANRSSCSVWMEKFSSSLGCNAYFYQRSRSDERNGRQGSRAFYWAKDLNAQATLFTLPDNPVICMVDVDEYVDMPRFLTTHAHPVLIYTFQPSKVCRTDKNYSYTFKKNNCVSYRVTGGGYYEHLVWNYSTDHLAAIVYWCGIPVACTSYLVDRRKTAEDHEMILLTPQGSWNGVGAVLYWFLYSTPLARLRVAQGDFLRLRVFSENGLHMSTGIAEAYNCATIPVAIDDTIASIARTNKHDLAMPHVMSFVDGDREASSVLLEYHRSKILTKPDTVCPVDMGIRRYQFDPRNFDSGAKPGMIPFMQPLVHEAFVPDRTLGNEERCVAGRIEEVRPAELATTPFLEKVMAEFVSLLIPSAGQLHPTDYDEVLNRQPKPSQRMILEMAESMLPERMVKMFIKKEPYLKPGDPRPISQINGVDKRDYSQFIYSFEKVLKQQRWYAFARTPKDIAYRVAEVCSKAKTVINTDFSRFDGHVSNLLRDLERMALLRAFAPQHHPRLLELHRSQYGLKAVATFGTWYVTEYSRASGSPETSLLNSLVNAFVAFLTLRKTKRNGLYLNAEEAFIGLGIYGGDDGLTADTEEATYVAAASMIGQKLTAEPVKRGKLGVKFLARIYSPHVWYGDANSCCDIVRQLSKFHVTVALPPGIGPIDKFVQKARSYVLSDENTPVIGLLCVKGLNLGGISIARKPGMEAMDTWLSRYDKDCQYPNEAGDWMLDYVTFVFPTFDFDRFAKWITDCKTVQDLLTPPLFIEPKQPATPAVPLVVDDVVLPFGTRISVVPPRVPFQSKLEAKEHWAQEDDGSGLDHKHLPTPQERFEEVKERKVKLGKFEDRPETFEQMKIRKIAAGTWKEKPVVAKKVQRAVPNTRPQKRFVVKGASK